MGNQGKENNKGKGEKGASLDLLVEAAQGGDGDAFTSIYDQLVTPIYRYIYYRVDQEIAEDLTEEVFLRAWQNLKKYKKSHYPFTSWVFKIAHNLVADHYRRHKVTDPLDDNTPDDKGAEHPGRSFDITINQLTLKKAIHRLPENYQQVILLKYINELDNTSISQVLGKTEGAIRLIQFRALAQLRSLIDDKKEDF